MSHPHAGSLSTSKKPTQTKTVFLPSDGTLAVIVTARGEKMTKREKRFTDAHAALSWAMQNDAGFVFFRGEQPDIAHN